MRRSFKKKKIFLLSSILIVTLFMSAGYSILNQKIEVSGTANLYISKSQLWYKIKDKNEKSTSCTNNCIEENTYESNRYMINDKYSLNTIKLPDNSEWYIISIEPDNTVKILSKTPIKIPYDKIETLNRSSTSTYCKDSLYGCNAWNSTSLLINDTISGSVLNDSTLNTYLNTTYYNSLSDSVKNLIETHDFYVGAVDITSTANEIYNQERSKIWTGNVGLINVSDIKYNEELYKDKFSNEIIWTINMSKGSNTNVVAYSVVNSSNPVFLNREADTSLIEVINNNLPHYEINAYPVMYLKSTVKAGSDYPFNISE